MDRSNGRMLSHSPSDRGTVVKPYHNLHLAHFTCTLKKITGICRTQGYISDLIKPYTPQRSLRSANKGLLATTTYNNKTYGSRAFSNCAPKLWNDLPQEIRQSSSLETFKNKLKTHLFKLAYCADQFF